MNVGELSKSRGSRLALIVLGAAVVALGWASVRAFRGEPYPQPEARTLASAETMRRPIARAPADIQTAVDNDLFSSDRSAPSTSYRMPGESSDEKVVVEAMKPNVLGTAVATDGRNFATLKLGDSSPQLVRVGDKIGEWVVRGIARGKVVLVSSNGTRAELTVMKPGT